MNKILITLFFLLFLNVNAQKKNSNTKKKTVQETITSKKDDFSGDDFRVPIYADTVYIKAGNPKIIIFDIFAQNRHHTANMFTEQEIKELKANFKEFNLEVSIVNKHSYYIFDNGQYIDASDANNSYQSAVFWKDNDNELKVHEGLRNLTDFASVCLGVDIKSNFEDKNRKNGELAISYLSKNNRTSNSEIVLKRYLNNIRWVAGLENMGDIFKTSCSKLKSIRVLETQKSNKSILKTELQLNNLQQPTLKIDFDDTKIYEKNYTYEGSFLIASNWNDEIYEKINYDDQEMIVYNDAKVDQVKTITVYSIMKESENLIYKKFMVYDTDYSNPINFIFEDKHNGKYFENYKDDELLSKNYTSKKGVFPYFEEYTSYQDGVLMQKLKSKIEKVTETCFKLYYENQESKKYELSKTYFVNNHKMLTKVIPASNQDPIITLEYSYHD
ncbi:hypothetical protein [Flavobacterium sp.]|uniref:hypothetical protein n=1 Tax=Flavobacterium sp. TaxID=239 RepID=UPI00286DAB1A|nr:hypothetical protein [Flavobacterium sp.]